MPDQPADHAPTQPAAEDPGFVDLGFARVDTDRLARTGDTEVVYGEGKTVAQTLAIVAQLRQAHPDGPVLVTRTPPATVDALAEAHGDAVIDAAARTVTVGLLPAASGDVVVVAAGTSDLPVAREVLATLAAFGAGSELVADVGVAGIHRLLASADRLRSADAVVVVAGMDGALPSAVGGLVGCPVVAVPTSVGYGASFGGVAALLTMLTSCAPGVTVVNIDNGFGAGVAAARIARRIHR